ncbi:MAG: hypothetical protein UW70_C0091G0001, partial [Candidatus Peregrinibacteria bacterium GW2011_GWA2_44_7]
HNQYKIPTNSKNPTAIEIIFIPRNIFLIARLVKDKSKMDSNIKKNFASLTKMG